MIFPFSIRFSARLATHIGNQNYPTAMKVIETVLKEKKGNIIHQGDSEITYKGTSSLWKTNILQPVDKGTFKIDEAETTVLKYKISFSNLFGFATIAGLFFGVISQEVWTGITAFGWLGGMNWVIALVRHNSMLTEIVDEIDLQIGNKPND